MDGHNSAHRLFDAGVAAEILTERVIQTEDGAELTASEWPIREADC